MTRVLLCAFSLVAFSMSPFEKNHPLVDEGMRAYEQGNYEGALEKFNAAQQQVPGNATIEYDRGLTLHKLDRHEEARQALTHALELDTRGELKEKIHYNLGNVWAATQNKKEAISEYRKALRIDPHDEAARHNLEVLLKDLPPPPKNSPDGGTEDGGKGDAGRPDAGPDGGKADGGRPTDGGRGDAGNSDAGSDGGQDGGQGDGDGGADGGKGDGGQGDSDKQGEDAGHKSSGDQGDGGTDGGTAQQDGGQSNDAEMAEMLDAGMSPDQAKKMLDQMKNSERNLQLWRFQKKTQRTPSEKDW